MNFQEIFAKLGGITGVGGDKLNPMSESEITAFEEELGVRLPKAYRTFLADYGASTFNGTSPENPYILFRPVEPLPPQFRSGKGMVDALYGGERGPHDGYSVRVRTRFFAGRMPESIIPIGDDGLAGQICLGIKGAEAGKVYYWDQQNEPQDEDGYFDDHGKPRPPEVMFQNVHLIAESFEDFLRRLDVKAD